MSEAPTIIVDRAIGHYFDDFAVDQEALIDYYDSLPIDSKAPLNQCTIYFSALAVGSTQQSTLGYGVRLVNPSEASKFDPQAPESDIMVFMGSLATRDKLHKLDLTFKHELVHYAEARPADNLSVKERNLMIELSLLRGRLSKVTFIGGTALSGGLIYGVETATGYGNLLVDMGLGLLAQVGRRAWRYKRNKERAMKISKELFDIAQSLEAEESARAHSAPRDDEGGPIVTAVRNETTYDFPIRTEGRGVINKTIDFAHKRLSLTPKVSA